jgi:hypothetical protein
MGDVLLFDGVTRLDLPPDHVLAQATGHLKSVVILGYDLDGVEYFASSLSDGADVLWLLERCKQQLLSKFD